MKRIRRYKRFMQCFFTLALFGGLLTGCIKDDYKNCPTTGDYVLRVKYMNNTIKNTFDKEIARLDFFVFDDKGFYYDRITDVSGPFTNDYSKVIKLPFGKYQVVLWGNLYNDHELSQELVRGVTTKKELLLKLKTTQTRNSTQPQPDYPKLENFVPAYPTTLFWGETGIQEIFSGHSVEGVVDLLKHTHDIHVTLRWKNLLGFYCFSKEHIKTTRAYIVGGNGDVSFDYKMPLQRNVTYIPMYRDPANPDQYLGQTGLSSIPPQIIVKDIAAVMPDFRVMRLMSEGSTEKLVVTTILDDGTEKIVYVRSLVDLIHLTGHYNTQASIDETNDYHIAVDFRCVNEDHQAGSSWISIGITVNGWVVKDVESEI